MLDRRAWKRIRGNPLVLIGICTSSLLVFVALLAPFLAPFDPNGITRETLYERYEPPSAKHWFGTDELGRDVLSRVVYGARISLAIGVSSRTAALAIGVILGCMAGYFGGYIDQAIMRLVDITMAFPFLLLVVAIAVLVGEGLFGVFVALASVSWAAMARLMRGQVLTVRHRDFVIAARAYGAGDFTIILRHVLPNCFAPALVWWTMGLAQAILAEAGLSFLGLGAQPPTPSWGSMIQTGGEALRVAPWTSIFPGVALAITVLGFNLLGDGLRDALDPKGLRSVTG